MKYLVVLCLIFFQNLLHAQSFTKVFSYGDTLMTYLALEEYPDKGWIAGGMLRSGSQLSSFVSRFDSTGNLLWNKKPEYSRDIRAVIALDNGDLLVFNNNTGFTQYFDASVLQLDANGNFRSEIVWGTPDDQDDWFDAAKLSDGSVVAVGMSRQSNSIIQRVMLARFSDTGQLLWEKMYDTNEFLTFRKIVPMPSGDFFILGDVYDTTNSGVLVARCNQDGDILWAKEYAHALEAQDLLDATVSGNDEITMATIRYVGVSFETVLIRLNGAGAVLGQTRISNGQDMFVIGIGVMGNDTLALAAVSRSIIFPPTDVDFVIARLTKNGDLIDHITFGSDDQDFGTDALFRDGEMIFCGFTDASIDGTARRGVVGKASPKFSCCRKAGQLAILPPDDLPLAVDYALSATQTTTRQNIIVSVADMPLTEEITCQSFEETNILPADTSFCIGEVLALQPVFAIPGAYLWSTGETTPGIAVSAPGTYALTINSECGVLRDTVVISSRGAIPDIVVSPDTTVCSGGEAFLLAAGGTAFSWRDAGGLVLSDDAGLVAAPDSSAVFSVIVSIGACSDTASVAVTVRSAPVVTASPDTLVPQGAPAYLRASGAAAWLWQPATGLSCTDCPDPIALNEETVSYTVTGFDAFGCADTDTVTVEIKKPCPYYVPNIFAPGNAIGLDNDLFRVYGSDILPDGFLLRIYSRWGDLVFETQDATAYWDGSIAGEQAQPGVYVYQLEMNTCDGPVRKSGDITLIR